MRRKRFISSAVVPRSTSTPAAWPAPIARCGRSRSTWPSTTGCSGRPSSNGVDSDRRCCAASRSARDSSRSRSTSPGPTPASARNFCATTVARSGSWTCAPAPLWGMARLEQARAAGAARSTPTLIAPADSPKIVTWSGSPPNAAMLSRTHSSAAIWSRMPALPGPSKPGRRRSSRCRKPNDAEPVVDRHDDDVAVRREARAVVPGRSTRCRSTNAPPWIHTMTGRPASSHVGREHVEVRQSSLADAPSDPSIDSRAEGSAARRARPSRHGRTPSHGSAGAAG